MNPIRTRGGGVAAGVALATLVAALAAWEVAMAQDPLKLRSPSFGDGETIPKAFTCEGDDKSPALEWSGVPDGTKSFALTVFDPDAPRPQGWVHWVVHDIPAGITELPPGGGLPSGAKAVQNDFGKSGYGGPCPPPGHGPHRYQFTLYALPTAHLDPAPVSYQDLAQTAEKQALATARLEGLYERK